MAIANGNVGTVAKSTSNTSTTITTAWDSGSGSDRILLVNVAYEDGGDASEANRKRIDWITYNGADLTRAGATYQAANANREQHEVWYLLDPDTGSNNLVVQFLNAAEDGVYIIAAKVYTGVSAIGAVAQNILASNSAAETITSTALTFTNAAARGHIGLALSTAGMGPVDSVSGWTVDHEDEQGTVDGGSALSLGYYDTDAASAKTFTWSPGASTSGSRYWGFVAVELIPLVAAAITTDSPTYLASDQTTTRTITVTRGGDFPSTPTATLAGVSLTRVSSSGDMAVFNVPSTSLFEFGQPFAAVRWKTDLTLRVTDSGGDMDATIQIYPPIEDHFDTLAGGVFDYAPVSSANGDDCYIDRYSGDGEGIPIIAGYQGSTVPTRVLFRVYDTSGSTWLTAIDHTFDIAASAGDGELYDTFTGSGNLTSHTPDTQLYSRPWVLAKDVSTASTTLDDANVQVTGGQLVISGANQGGEYNLGDTDFDLSVVWAVEATDSRWALHIRRVDDTEHVHIFVRKDGIVSVNHRVGSVNQSVNGVASVSGLVFTEGNTYRIKLAAAGPQIQVFIDDVLTLDVTTAVAINSRATKFGIFSGSSSYIPVKFNEVNAYSSYTPAARLLTFGPVVTF